MIDQVCSMALTYAHSDGRAGFERDRPRRGDDDGRVRRRDRPAVPEARGARDRDPRGRPRRLLRTCTWRTGSPRACRSASAAPPAATTRRWRSRTASAHWRSEEVGELIWGLGAMAAEYVFYGQNTTGVGGDVGTAHRATPRAWSAAARWRPRRSTSPTGSRTRGAREEEEERVDGALRAARHQIMHRSGGGMHATTTRLGACSATATSAGWSPACSARRSSIAYNTIALNRDGHRLRRRAS